MNSIVNRIDNFTKIKPEQLKEFAPFPKSVKIELTAACNFQCSFCPLQDRPEKSTSVMDFDFFKRITTEMKECGVEEIGLFYIGESMLQPKLLIDSITFLKQELKISNVFLTSNASVATQETLSGIMKAGLDSLKWSVNAYDKEQFAKVMGVNPNLFDKASENIKNAYLIRKHCHYKTQLYASSIKYDGEQQAKMEEHLKAKILPYVDEHYWLPLYNSTGSAKKRQKTIGHAPVAGNIGRLGALRDPLPCWVVFTIGHVRVDGSLTACFADADGTWDVANLHETSFKDAWNSEKFRALRRAHIAKDITGTPCEDCILTK